MFPGTFAKFFNKHIGQRLGSALAALLVMGIVATGSTASTKREVLLGYFEGGPHPGHQAFRAELDRQLASILPDSITALFIPQGYRSAAWDRDSAKIYAEQLVRVDRVEIMITAGPWAVEELLRAGYTKPIVASYRFDPAAEGLLSANGQPKAQNLTLTRFGGIVERDLSMLARLKKIDRLGVLYFHDSGGGEEQLTQFTRVAARSRMEVVSAEGYNNAGTFAFFAAYRKLTKNIDALYVGPLWGMDAVRVKDFLAMVRNDRLPLFTSEGALLVDNGAFASNAGFTYLTEARITAHKILRIIRGEKPVHLPVTYDVPVGLSLNLATASACDVSLPSEALSEGVTFGSAIPPDAERYTLGDVLTRVLAASPGKAGAEERLRAARLAGLDGRSLFAPRIEGSLQYQARVPEEASDTRYWLGDDGLKGELTLTSLLLSLESSASRGRRGALLESEVEKNRRGEILLRTAATTAFLAARTAAERVQVFRESRLAIERNLELSLLEQALSKTDRGVKQLTWESERLKGMIALAEAQEEEKRIRLALLSLMNLPLSAQFNLDTTFFSETALFGDFHTLRAHLLYREESDRLRDYLLGELRATNSDYRLARSGTDQPGSHRSAISRLLPDLEFRTGLHYGNHERKLSSPFSDEQFSWSIGGGAHWRGLESLLGFSPGNVQEAQNSAAEYARDSVYLAETGELLSILGEVQKLMQITPLTIRWRRNAKTLFENAALQFEKGVLAEGPFLDVHDDLTSAMKASVDVRYRFYQELLELTSHLGWRPNDPAQSFHTDLFNRLQKDLPAPNESPR